MTSSLRYSIMACTQILLPTGLCSWGSDHLTFEGGMGDFTKKYPADWFEGKNSCKEILYLAKKDSYTEKNVFRGVWLWKKSYSAAVVCQEKRILSPVGLGENILSPPNHPYHPRNPTHSPSMSNGRCSFRFLCCSAPLFLVFLMFPCSCAPLVSYPASIARERQTFLLALIPLEGRSQRR